MNGISVVKIGGSSLATTERIINLARILSERDEKLIIVVSAMGDTTDELIDLAKKVNNKAKKREMDMLMVTGEQVSSTLMSMALQSFERKAIALTGFQAGIVTTGRHQTSTIKKINISVIYDYLKKYDCIVVTGFQGINEKNDFTTLGRGGSDTTAVALAAKLKTTCEIYTDVQGVYSIDPRKSQHSYKLNEINYEQMLELAIAGSGILAARSVELALKYNVPIYVGKLDSNKYGTWIREV